MLLDVEQTLKQTTILCRVLLEQTLNNRPILCRVLLDVEQTLNNRPLSYVECC